MEDGGNLRPFLERIVPGGLRAPYPSSIWSSRKRLPALPPSV
jgi:hypothetical protein